MANLKFIGLLFLCACTNTNNYYNLPAFVSENTINTVIEIPAGTNAKYEFNPIKKKFQVDTVNGKKRIIDFLPYIGNYGFIPSTLSNTALGGDGDALDVLVLSESIPTGTVIETLPIALLKLIDDEEKDYKIIAIPTNQKLQIMNANSLHTLRSKYPEAIKIMELWFLNYNPNDSSQIEGWGNEKEALDEIKKHLNNE